MALVSGHRSTLNPNAPVFIPLVYRQVEDFSPAWWDLVKTSTWFRDFWLSKNPEDEFVGFSPDEGLADLENELEELMKLSGDEEKKKPDYGVKSDLKGLVKELSLSNAGKWRNVEAPPANAVKKGKKGSYWLSNKSSPRRIRQIHQPR